MWTSAINLRVLEYLQLHSRNKFSKFITKLTCEKNANILRSSVQYYIIHRFSHLRAGWGGRINVDTILTAGKLLLVKINLIVIYLKRNLFVYLKKLFQTTVVDFSPVVLLLLKHTWNLPNIGSSTYSRLCSGVYTPVILSIRWVHLVYIFECMPKLRGKSV